jgi:DHA1 family multidrug resistance protein-like MFS transporter
MPEDYLTPRRQMTSIVVLLGTTGLMWFGFFMLIPLVAVHITRDLHMGAAVAGLVLAVRQFTQFGLGLFTGALADWGGYRRMILLGMLVRALGFAWLAFASDVLTLLLSGITAAVGGAFFDSSGKAALAAVSRGYKRETIFALSTTIGNIGMTTGPLLGVALLKMDFAVVGLASASLYLVNFGLIWLFIPKLANSGQRRGGARQMFRSLGKVWHNRTFVLISALTIGYYIIYSQINITLPLEAERLTGSEDSVSLLYVINSGLAITLQFLSMRLLARFFKSTTVIAMGTLVAGVGLWCISFVNTYPLLLACVVVYALGRLVVEPISAVLVAEHATEETLASYFGFSSLAMGFGGIFGNALGGWLFDLGPQVGFDGLCWWFFGIVGLVVVGGVLVLQHYQKRPMVAPELVAPSLGTATASPNHE